MISTICISAVQLQGIEDNCVDGGNEGQESQTGLARLREYGKRSATDEMRLNYQSDGVMPSRFGLLLPMTIRI